MKNFYTILFKFKALEIENKKKNFTLYTLKMLQLFI